MGNTMKTTLWMCRKCNAPTQNYRKCPRCHQPAELVTFELVEIQAEAIPPDEHVQVSLVEFDKKPEVSQLLLGLAWRSVCTNDAPGAEPQPTSTAHPSDMTGL